MSNKYEYWTEVNKEEPHRTSSTAKSRYPELF